MASLCFSLGCVALGVAISNLADVSARVWMRGWEEGRRISLSHQWDLAYERLILARRLNPLNADYSADAGRLMEWRSWQYLPESSTSSESRARAARYYEETLVKRPSWGFAWAQYAENRLLSGTPDHQFVAALEMAIRLAPWEPGVQRKVAWMGMATWDALPGATRDQVEQSIARTVSLETELEDLVRLAVQYDWLDHLRPMMRGERQSVLLHRTLERMRRR